MSKDKSPKVVQRDKIKETLNIKTLDWTVKQKEIIDNILSKESKIIFISGPAGSGKSSLTTYSGLNLINQKKLSDYIFLRSPLECSDSAGLGFTPGTIDEKFAPYMQVLLEKLDEFLINSDIQKLKNDSRIQAIPTNYLRGSTFNAKFIHVEEAQSLTFKELMLILTRYGQFSKLIIVGDPVQSDLPEKKQGGLSRLINIFNNQESRDKGIFCHFLSKSDIKRSDITSFILEKVEKEKESDNSMFPYK